MRSRVARLVQVTTICAIGLIAPGCGTLVDVSRRRDPGRSGVPRVLGGLRTDAGIVLGGTWGVLRTPTALAVVFALDMPLSLAADVVLLPITLPWALFGDSGESPETNEVPD